MAPTCPYGLEPRCVTQKVVCAAERREHLWLADSQLPAAGSHHQLGSRDQTVCAAPVQDQAVFPPGNLLHPPVITGHLARPRPPCQHLPFIYLPTAFQVRLRLHGPVYAPKSHLLIRLQYSLDWAYCLYCCALHSALHCAAHCITLQHCISGLCCAEHCSRPQQLSQCMLFTALPNELALLCNCAGVRAPA